MNNAKDLKMSELGRNLASLKMSSQLLPTSQAKLKAIEQLGGTNKLRNVRALPSGRLAYIVQFYMGCAIRTFASVPSDLFLAARIADMVTLRMGKWRLRFPKDPTDADFNFSREQAQADWDNEPLFVEVLLEQEKHLRSIGALLDPNNPVPPSKDASSKHSEQLDRIEAQLEKLLQLCVHKTVTQ